MQTHTNRYTQTDTHKKCKYVQRRIQKNCHKIDLSLKGVYDATWESD